MYVVLGKFQYSALSKKWKSCNDKGKPFGVLMADLLKAFDCLSHEFIITKLHEYGFLTRKFFFGVPQGSTQGHYCSKFSCKIYCLCEQKYRSNTVVSIGPCAEKFNVVTNDHGYMHKCDFSVFDQKYPFRANLVKKSKKCQFKLRFRTMTNSNMQN